MASKSPKQSKVAKTQLEAVKSIFSSAISQQCAKGGQQWAKLDNRPEVDGSGWSGCRCCIPAPRRNQLVFSFYIQLSSGLWHHLCFPPGRLDIWWDPVCNSLSPLILSSTVFIFFQPHWHTLPSFPLPCLWRRGEARATDRNCFQFRHSVPPHRVCIPARQINCLAPVVSSSLSVIRYPLFGCVQ